MTDVEREVEEVLAERANRLRPSLEPPAGLAGRARRRRTAKVVATVMSSLAAVALVGTVAVLRLLDDGGAPTISADDQTPRAGRGAVLAATRDGRLVVLGADGTELRELDHVPNEDASTGFAISPDGRFAFFDRGGVPECDARVVRVDLADGDEDVAADGLQPALSPDGRRLAYLDCPDGSEIPDQLVVRELESGREERRRAPGRVLHRPSWAPDSRHLAVQLNDQPGQPVVVVDIRAHADLETGPRVVLEHSDNNLGWAGYRGTAGDFWSVWNPRGEAAGQPGALQYVLAHDPESGVARTLFALEVVCCQPLAVDDTGHRILVSKASVDGNAGELLVWAEDGGSFTKLADGDYTTAAFVPG